MTLLLTSPSVWHPSEPPGHLSAGECLLRKQVWCENDAETPVPTHHDGVSQTHTALQILRQRVCVRHNPGKWQVKQTMYLIQLYTPQLRPGIHMKPDANSVACWLLFLSGDEGTVAAQWRIKRGFEAGQGGWQWASDYINAGFHTWLWVWCQPQLGLASLLFITPAFTHRGIHAGDTGRFSCLANGHASRFPKHGALSSYICHEITDVTRSVN